MSSSRHWALSCAAANCEETKHLFAWPRGRTSTDVQRAKWTAFVKKHVANFRYKTISRICFRHFTEECFSNYHQYRYQQGEDIRLMLKKHSDIIPTRNLHIKADSAATPRKQKPITLLPTRERRAVVRGLLADAVPAVPRTATFFSHSRSKIPVRNHQPAESFGPGKSSKVDKGVQLRKCLHRPKYRSISTQTDAKQPDLPASPPSKRKMPVVDEASSIPSTSKQLQRYSLIMESDTSDEMQEREEDLGKALDEEEWVPDSDNSETEDEVSEESFEGCRFVDEVEEAARQETRSLSSHIFSIV
ncbi:uncharacterized protein [Watersipora subatra]|uniref:uncharacterized protein isoform X2 n=1 Tax=Watersipora subatra TaxID=2589382 RepID=UPI00355B5718